MSLQIIVFDVICRVKNQVTLAGKIKILINQVFDIFVKVFFLYILGHYDVSRFLVI